MLETHSASLMESKAQLAHRAIVRMLEERIASPGFLENFAFALASTETEADNMVLKQLLLLVLMGTMIDAAMPYLRTLDDCASDVVEIDKCLKLNKLIILFYNNNNFLLFFQYIVRLPYFQHPPSTFSCHFYSVCLPRIVLLSAFPPLDSPVWQKHLSGTLCILFESFGVPMVSSSCVNHLKHQP
jgi:hypothetical protein